MKINNHKIKISILFITHIVIILGILLKIKNLNEKLENVENSLINKNNVIEQIISKKFKNKLESIISIECHDKHEKNTWHGTASKINKDTILTAEHVFSYIYTDSNDKEYEAEHPIHCSLFNGGTLIGHYNETKNNYKQIQERDIILFKVKFNEEGIKKSEIHPEPSIVVQGQPLILIAHPDTFVNDPIITSGIVANNNVQKSLPAGKKIYWENAIVSDMSATSGSSGAPVFTIEGKFIGIHVGGANRKMGLQLNYQLIFNSKFEKF